MAASNTLFSCFKTTGDAKHDIQIYIQDLGDYTVMQNGYDSSKRTEVQRRIKTDKAITCLGTSLPPAARTIYKYSFGLSDEDQKKPHLAIDVLRKFYGASIGVSGRGKNFSVYFKRKMSRSFCGKREFRIKEHNVSMKILQTNL